MKLTHAAHAVEIGLIVFLGIYTFVLAPTQSKTGIVTMSDFIRPADLATSVNSTEDVFDDLTSLGCRLVNVSVQSSSLESYVMVSNYSDFRWIAYNTKLVFFAAVNGQIVCYFTPYQGVLIAFSPALQSDMQENTTRYENLYFTGAYATKNSGTFTVHLTVKNVGATAATIDISSILYNGVPASDYESTAVPVAWFGNLTLAPGQSTLGNITLTEGTAWVSGMTLELMIHTISGNDYAKVVMLP